MNIGRLLLGATLLIFAGIGFGWIHWYLALDILALLSGIALIIQGLGWHSLNMPYEKRLWRRRRDRTPEQV